MLKSIAINNFAIISALRLDFGPGLNVFTGETGAGKSIVIEALGFALGARGDAGLIRHGTQKMATSAVFEAASLPAALAQKYKLTRADFCIKRELDQKGKSRAWVNDIPVLMADLAALGDILVDFHGQHEHQTLFKPAAHLDILDSFAGLEKDLKAFRAVYDEERDIKAKIAAVQMSRQERESALELYKYQLEEIEKLSLKPEEDSQIETALPRLKHAAKLKEQASSSYELLEDTEGGACALLSKASHTLGDMAGVDSSLRAVESELASALAIAQETARVLRDYHDNIKADPQTLDDMLSRQEVLRKIKLKYGPALEDVLNTAQNLKKRIADLAGGAQSAQKLESALANVHKKLLSLSEGLSEARRKAARKLGALVAAEVAPLGFAQVRFEAALEQNNEIGPKGADSLEFLFSPNPGSALRPLRSIASGGEISRLMLGLKTVLNGGTPVAVFDEIDAGISGQTGKLVGQKLKAASSGRQILCVTHLPQVAAYGDTHFSVGKFVKNNNTEVNVEPLGPEERILEIARMMGAAGKASAGHRHAQDLLSEAAACGARQNPPAKTSQK
ncbi:MAG: DNA repair protein RecN [Elusimicrobiota bacterium]|nr:DNA repair protein RecN [Elusimicrobiota bacterium]